MKKKSFILLGVVSLIVWVLLLIFMPNDILLEPLLTPNELLASKPHIEIFGITAIVPTSTLIVYGLGIYILYLAYLMFKREKHLWALSFLFWGIGTLLAGTSYQGLGYELKCAGLEYCMFTSWFELAYLYVTGVSMSFFSLAFANDLLDGKRKKWLNVYAYIAMPVYTVLLLIGSIFSIYFLITYELFTLFFMPMFIVMFFFNISLKKAGISKGLNQKFIYLWIIFVLVNLGYYVYYFVGITAWLYETLGIWFSANDVLHVGLILWFVYFARKIEKKLLNKKEGGL